VKIIDNVFIVPGVVANPYIIVDADGLTVIDAGLPQDGKKILAYIASLGKSARDVKRIIITHADIDHFRGLAALQKASGARTYASRIEADAIARGRPSPPGRLEQFQQKCEAVLRPELRKNKETEH